MQLLKKRLLKIVIESNSANYYATSNVCGFINAFKRYSVHHE